jgi:hypothetical protein
MEGAQRREGHYRRITAEAEVERLREVLTVSRVKATERRQVWRVRAAVRRVLACVEPLALLRRQELEVALVETKTELVKTEQTLVEVETVAVQKEKAATRQVTPDRGPVACGASCARAGTGRLSGGLPWDVGTRHYWSISTLVTLNHVLPAAVRAAGELAGDAQVGDRADRQVIGL